MPLRPRLRGATTVDADTVEQVTERTVALLGEMLERNGVDHDDLISIFFTATDDIHSMFPATAARKRRPRRRAADLRPRARHRRRHAALHPGAHAHLKTETGRAELHHVYLEGARGLRDDLPD